MTGESYDDPFESMEVLDICASDTLVFHVDHPITKDQREALDAHLHAQFPENKICILDSGIRLSVIHTVPETDTFPTR